MDAPPEIPLVELKLKQPKAKPPGLPRPDFEQPDVPTCDVLVHATHWLLPAELRRQGCRAQEARAAARLVLLPGTAHALAACQARDRSRSPTVHPLTLLIQMRRWLGCCIRSGHLLLLPLSEAALLCL